MFTSPSLSEINRAEHSPGSAANWIGREKEKKREGEMEGIDKTAALPNAPPKLVSLSHTYTLFFWVP